MTHGRNDTGPKRPRAETTHLLRPKRPTPKIGRNDPGRNDPASMSRAMRKRVLCHTRTTKAQISLRIRAVWSRSLISAFVAWCLDSMMSLVSVTKISSLVLASVAAQAGLCLACSETPEDAFSHDVAHMYVLTTIILFIITYTVIFLSFRTDSSGQTVQTQIRLLPVWSGSNLFAIPSTSFGCITLRKRHLVQLLGWLQQMFWVSEYLGNLR